MRVIELPLYQFHELSDQAKDKARDNHRLHWQPVWCDESRESIEAFCAHFGVKLRDWRVDTVTFNYSHNATNDNFRGLKLKDFDREYMPTGYCLDCDLWMTFYDEFKRTGCARLAFNEALDAGFKSWRNDLEYQDSAEYIDEFFACNDYEFTEDGSVY